MKLQILTVEEIVGLGCAFEEWNKEKYKLCNCGKSPIISYGNNFICLDHLPDVLTRCGCVTMQGMKTGKKSVHPENFNFKEDFLKACKKEQYLRDVKSTGLNK